MNGTPRFVAAIDQGTTSTRCLVFDHGGRMVSVAQHEHQQTFPRPGWAEHDADEIWLNTLRVLPEALALAGLRPHDLAAVGIANQRETTIVWDPTTGEPIANAIVWQCRRTAALVEELCGGEDVRCMVQRKTGLLPDAYFSASKIRWLLDSVAGARERAQAGELLFGTVDSWLVWVLTGGLVHATDATNASRTMLYNIHEGRWDQELLRLFDIPMQMMPEVRPSAAYFGETSYPGVPAGIPICGVAGDQQAALFGQCCFEPGQAKNTYGTGCFLLMHTGAEAALSHNNLVTTVVATPPGCDRTEYALEGSVFVAGALVQWLRDELHLIRNAEDSEFLARGVDDTGGVYIVPAFTGLGAPWWQPDARGLICGITRGTTTAHLVRAALEALAYQTVDLVRAMEADAGVSLATLNVDGGASRNDFLMQFQADVLRSEIRRPKSVETTALGAAYLAGLTSGFWAGTDELSALRATDDVYVPHMDEGRARALLAGWSDAVRRTT